VTDTDLGAKSARNNSNVVRLPTAARRQVIQPTRAQREYLASQPKWPGEHLWPAERDARRMAAEKSPELLIVMAIIKVLTPEQRIEAANIVHKVSFLSGDDQSRTASIIMAGLAQ
jgi:hypothetical protein